MDVRTLRQHLGLTQGAFAKQLGVTLLTIHNWEAGTHQPKGQRLARLIDMAQRAGETSQAAPAAQQAQQAAGEPAAPPTTPPADQSRRVLSLGEAVRLMGLKDEGHGRRSDHTIRKAIKLKRLKAWKAPGTYRKAIAEWCFFEEDFEQWRAQHYQAHRDPRRSSVTS